MSGTDFIIYPQGLTRRVAEAIIIHASWTNVNFRGAKSWRLTHKIAAVKGLFHGYFNLRHLGRVVALMDPPSRKRNAPRGSPDFAMVALPIKHLWDITRPRHLKVKIFVAWHVSVTEAERNIALVIINSFISSKKQV